MIAFQRNTFPNAQIFVATLLPRLDAGTNTKINDYNMALKSYVQQTPSLGGKVFILDFNSVANPDASDLYDGIHPGSTLAEMLGMRAFTMITKRQNTWIPPSD